MRGESQAWYIQSQNKRNQELGLLECNLCIEKGVNMADYQPESCRLPRSNLIVRFVTIHAEAVFSEP